MIYLQEVYTIGEDLGLPITLFKETLSGQYEYNYWSTGEKNIYTRSDLVPLTIRILIKKQEQLLTSKNEKYNAPLINEFLEYYHDL